MNLNSKLEAGRLRSGPFASNTGDDYGAFSIIGPQGEKLSIISSGNDGDGWEHVSVSTKVRCPRWDEMSFVKDLFWREDQAVMQLHPPKSDWVNNHPYCLHLWRPTTVAIPLPPSILVGYKELNLK